MSTSAATRTRKHHRRRFPSGRAPMFTYDFSDPISLTEFIDVEPGVHLHHRFADHLG